MKNVRQRVKNTAKLVQDDILHNMSLTCIISKIIILAREYAETYMEEAMERDLQTCIDVGMEVCTPDLAEWKEATQSVRDTLGVKVWGEDGYATIKQIAEG